jgi:trigger factor
MLLEEMLNLSSSNYKLIMATVTRTNEGVLTDIITVELTKNDYYPTFEKALKKYSAQAKIPGFRPGMVPIGLVKKMYGKSVFTEEILRTVEKEINSYLEQEKPEIFAQPLPTEDNDNTIQKMDINNPSDYTFIFEIGLKPDFNVADLSGATITKRKVDVTDDLLNEEITRLQSRYGTEKEPETVENDQNVLNLTFTEVDADGNTVEGGVTKDSSMLVSYFSEAVRPQLIGLKKEDSLTIKLDEAFTGEQKEWILNELGLTEDGAGKSFKVIISKITFTETRELNQEFFDQLFPGKNVTSEEEFRAALKADLENYWNSQTSNQVHDEIYHYLLDHTNIEFPETFLKRWLKTGGEKVKTEEEVEAEFPAFLNSLRWNLISDNLLKQNQLDVQPEELRAFAKQQMMSYMGVTTVDESTAWLDAYVDRQMQDKKFLEQTYHQLLTNKLFGFAESQVTNYDEQLVSVEEFAAKQHHHHY